MKLFNIVISNLFGDWRQISIIPKSYLLIVFIVLTCNVLYGQTNNNAIDKQIDRLFSKYDSTTPGVAVAVVKDGKIVFKKGYGSANLEYDVPVTTKTVFHIASVSKQFTAFAIYLLEKQGKLSLEDDVRKYIAEVPDFGKTVKIKHLLAHTSGIKDQWSLLTLAGWRMDDVITMEHILKIISRQKDLNFEPGSQFQYSNSGYTLLAEIVKRISGQTFAEFTRDRIFIPLEMTNTQFYDNFEKVVKNRAYSYEKENGVYIKKNLNYSNVGATSLLTTAEDMAKWALNFENPKVGDAELIKRFNEPSLFNNGGKVVWSAIGGNIGYHAKGQILWDYRGTKQISHGGHDAGFRSSFWRFPEQRVAVIALSNDEHFQQVKNVTTIADLYLQNLKPTPTQTSNPVANKPIEKANTNLKDYEGRFYNDELETFYSAKVIDGKLFLSHIRHGKIELTDAGKDKFTGRIEFPVQVEFLRDGNGLISGCKIYNFGAKNMKFEKVNATLDLRNKFRPSGSDLY